MESLSALSISDVRKLARPDVTCQQTQFKNIRFNDDNDLVLGRVASVSILITK